MFIFIVSKFPNILEKILKINKKIFYLLDNRQIANLAWELFFYFW